MVTFLKTDARNADFTELVKQLDSFLAVKNGEEHSFYDQYNKIDSIKYAVVAYDGELPVACGAIKELAPDTMEVKRMFTRPEARGKGVAAQVLKALEEWAYELGYAKCVLETLKENTPAVTLYQKSGYAIIPNYGQYKGVEKSVCLEKQLK